MTEWTQKNEIFCLKCNKKLGFGQGKFPLKNNQNGQELLLCSKCYEALPKEEKLQLEPMKNIKGMAGANFLAFGLFGIGMMKKSGQKNDFFIANLMLLKH